MVLSYFYLLYFFSNYKSDIPLHHAYSSINSIPLPMSHLILSVVSFFFFFFGSITVSYRVVKYQFCHKKSISFYSFVVFNFESAFVRLSCT